MIGRYGSFIRAGQTLHRRRRERVRRHRRRWEDHKERSLQRRGRGGTRGAARHFADYYDAPFPGAKSLDPLITSGGRLNEKEAARFARDPKGVVAKRPDLLGHLDFFDRADGDGMITIGESYRGWRDLGTAR